MPDFLNGLFFSELLADNAGGSAIDVNGVSGANKQDEFIEIQNASNVAVDLTGYQLWSDKHGLLHSFVALPDGSAPMIAPGGTATVVGTYNNPPAGFYGANGNNNSASSNGGFLEDGEGSKFDTIYLVAPDGNYIQLSYGQNAQDPGGLPAGFPTGGTLQGSGEIISSGAPNGTSVLRDSEGNLMEGTPDPGTPGTVCFASGTLIATDGGEIAVDRLTPGTRVISRDHDHVPVRAIRQVPIGRALLRWNPDLRAIVIPAGVLGNGTPLRLSPPHRILFSGPTVELLFAQSEVLVSARQLVGYGGVSVDMSDRPVIYYHLLCDAHEVIRADGCWSESLFLGDAGHAALAAATGWRTEPGIDLARMMHGKTARMSLNGYEAHLLLDMVMDKQTGCLRAA